MVVKLEDIVWLHRCKPTDLLVDIASKNSSLFPYGILDKCYNLFYEYDLPPLAQLTLGDIGGWFNDYYETVDDLKEDMFYDVSYSKKKVSKKDWARILTIAQTLKLTESVTGIEPYLELEVSTSNKPLHFEIEVDDSIETDIAIV